jgi:ketol-acid reductoisomerase
VAPRSSTENTLHLIGFGSQAQAWAQCLRASLWSTPIYLSRPEGKSALRARELGFDSVHGLSALAELPDGALVAFLCPDTEIGGIYRSHLSSLDRELTCVLAHGYAVYAGELKPARAKHELALFAPKAIGPKVWALYQAVGDGPHGARGRFHRLVAGFAASDERAPRVLSMAQAMGFSPERLVRATFEQEAVGDMLSEQGLLCGGVFTLLEWTLEAMREAGVPDGLIREECLTELELIAGLLRERGPATTFKTISHAAQAGTIAMREALLKSDARTHFDAQLRQVLDGRFADYFKRGDWRAEGDAFERKLASFQDQLNLTSPADRDAGEGG